MLFGHRYPLYLVALVLLWIFEGGVASPIPKLRSGSDLSPSRLANLFHTINTKVSEPHASIGGRLPRGEPYALSQVSAKPARSLRKRQGGAEAMSPEEYVKSKVERLAGIRNRRRTIAEYQQKNLPVLRGIKDSQNLKALQTKFEGERAKGVATMKVFSARMAQNIGVNDGELLNLDDEELLNFDEEVDRQYTGILDTLYGHVSDAVDKGHFTVEKGENLFEKFHTEELRPSLIAALRSAL